MSFSALLALGLSLGAAALPTSSPLDNIKNIVVLIQENRSFDTLVGGLTYNSNIDGLVHTEYCNPANVSLSDSKNVCAANTAKNVASDDPDHTITGGNMQVFGDYHPSGSSKANMQGFITEQSYYYNLQQNMMEAAEVINYYAPGMFRAQ